MNKEIFYVEGAFYTKLDDFFLTRDNCINGRPQEVRSLNSFLNVQTSSCSFVADELNLDLDFMKDDDTETIVAEEEVVEDGFDTARSRWAGANGDGYNAAADFTVEKYGVVGPRLAGDAGDAAIACKKLPPKGIKDFWLQAMKNSLPLLYRIYAHDEPCLEYLNSVKVQYEDGMSFTIYFFFKPNPFFKNSLLWKIYVLNADVNVENPARFGIPVMKDCTSVDIAWYEGKDLTRICSGFGSNGELSYLPSFFNFFYVSEFSGVRRCHFVDDFVIAHYIRTELIPHAMICYFGTISDQVFLPESSGEENQSSADDSA